MSCENGGAVPYRQWKAQLAIFAPLLGGAVVCICPRCKGIEKRARGLAKHRTRRRKMRLAEGAELQASSEAITLSIPTPT